MLYVYFAIIIYIVLISLAAVIVTVKDKRLAKSHKWRIKESTLLWISVFGGSVAMLATMRTIRHKTKHLKFMLGIPVIIFLQAAFIIMIIYLTK